MKKHAPNFNMVSELVEFKGHIPIHAPNPKGVLGVRGVLWENLKSHIG